MNRISLFIAVVSLSSFAQAGFGKHFTLCRNEKEVRTLRVDLDDATGKCQANYNKYGKDQSVGSSSNIASCDSFVSHVRGNLEHGGWTCKEIKEATVSQIPDQTL